MKRNRTMFVAAFAAVLMVAVAGWSVLQPSTAAPVAPAAADQTLGMALMSATVDQTTNIVSGAGALSVSRPATGFADVTFNRNLSNCSCTASVGASGIGLYYNKSSATANCPYAANSVRVITQDGGTYSNDGFHLIVFCPK